MGKGEDGHSFPSTVLDEQGTNHAVRNGNRFRLSCSRFQNLVSLRCVFVLALGFAVLLSAVFWLPFSRFGPHKDLDLDYEGHDIVASFVLRKPGSFLREYIVQLQNDIFDEMSYTSAKVEIISLEPSANPNVTKVVFAVESDVTTQSLIRASFLSMITHQSPLHLTRSLFGDPLDFDVLKFKGGITVSPEQKAFLMQTVQILFNFTLNFSIDEILINFEELRSQLNTGLHLAPYENLYIRLTNLRGSTVAPPTTIQSQVLLAVGIDPSRWRLQQLARTITGSHSKNLGLNHTLFGRVKQVSLSSALQHSLGGDAGSPPSPSPSPSLVPPVHLYHRSRRHPHHHTASPSPTSRNRGSVIGGGSPASAPVLAPKPAPPLPSPACRHGHRVPWKCNECSHAAPSYLPDYAPGPSGSQTKQKYSPPPKRAPFLGASPPNDGHGRLIHPPSRSVTRAMPIVSSPSPSPSSADILSSNIWALLLAILLALLL